MFFCTEYNLSFFKPKKDQCSICNMKKQGEVDDSVEKELKNIRTEKLKLDQKRIKFGSRRLKDFMLLHFIFRLFYRHPEDFYNKRKLSCFNLSMYSPGDRNGTCHVWGESQASRGVCEIASYLVMHNNAVTKGPQIKELHIFTILAVDRTGTSLCQLACFIH